MAQKTCQWFPGPSIPPPPSPNCCNCLLPQSSPAHLPRSTVPKFWETALKMVLQVLQCGCLHRYHYSGFLSGTKRRCKRISSHHRWKVDSWHTGSRSGLVGAPGQGKAKENRAHQFTDPITACMNPSSPIQSSHQHAHYYVY